MNKPQIITKEILFDKKKEISNTSETSNSYQIPNINGININEKDQVDIYGKIETFKPENITTLRLPIFCSDNKPFIYIKVKNENEKYRVSMSPEFLKNYNLKFKILRDQSLKDFFKSKPLKEQNIITMKNYSQNSSSDEKSSIYIKLPIIQELGPNGVPPKIQKHTIILENDGKPGKTLIDKYQFVFGENRGQLKIKKTVIFLIDRIFDGQINSSLTFISDEFNNIQEFLNEYKKHF